MGAETAAGDVVDGCVHDTEMDVVVDVTKAGAADCMFGTGDAIRKVSSLREPFTTGERPLNAVTWNRYVYPAVRLEKLYVRTVDDTTID